MYICACARAHACTHTHIRSRTHTHTYAHAHARTHTPVDHGRVQDALLHNGHQRLGHVQQHRPALGVVAALQQLRQAGEAAALGRDAIEQAELAAVELSTLCGAGTEGAGAVGVGGHM